MRHRNILNLLFVIFFLSGFAGLGYEMVWTRMLSFGLGHEFAATIAVLASFFSGLAIGAYCLDGAAARSNHPNILYATLELVIGGWGLLLIWPDTVGE